MALSDLSGDSQDAVGGLSLGIDLNPSQTDVWTLERGLFAFEEARLGKPNHSHFAIFFRDAHNEVQGGVDCHIMWRRAFVKTLWISQSFRGRGLGSRLIQAAEAEAIRRESLSVWLTALGQRACHFYERLDYRIFGVHDDYVRSEVLYSLRKDL